MNTDEHGFGWEGITQAVIGCAFNVSNELGCGFLEKPYENALAIELRSRGIRVDQQHPIQICYKGEVVGEYVADLIVEDTVLVELKCARNFDEMHMAQCLNYLKATGKPVCLLLNFGKPKVEVKRIINQIIPQSRTERLINQFNSIARAEH